MADTTKILVGCADPIRTPVTRGFGEEDVAGQAISRLGEPDEVAAMVRFIAAEATFSTGSEFVIDGGATAGTVLVLPAVSR